MKKQNHVVIKAAKKRGWYLARQRNHLIYKHKRGGIVAMSKTASERRAWYEVKKDFIHQEKIHKHNKK